MALLMASCVSWHHACLMCRQVTVGQVDDKVAELNRFCKAVMGKPKPAPPPPPPPKADAPPGQFVARFGMHACVLRPSVLAGGITAVKGWSGKDDCHRWQLLSRRFGGLLSCSERAELL